MSPDHVRPRLTDNNFDLLRLVFSSMVVVFHVGILSQEPALRWLHLYVSSTFAVQAFFIVSGFLVTMSYERSSSLKSYASKRFWRIAPAYVTVVVGAALLFVWASTLDAAHYFTDKGWRDYLVYNLLLSNFSAPSLPGVFAGNSEQAVNGSLWTIKIEVAFYCLVPVMVWLSRRFGHVRALTTLFLLSVAWKCGFTVAADLTGSDLMLRLAKQIPGQLAFFIGGALAYYRTQAGLPPPKAWLAALSVLLYIVLDGLLLQALAPVLVTVIVYWLAIAMPRLGHPGKHGDFSYGLYLYHFPVVQLMVQEGWFHQSPWWALAALLVAATVLAVSSWFLVERRFLGRRAAHP